MWDVGCGNGEFLERMWAAGIRAIGIDRNADLKIANFDTLRRTLCSDATTCRTLHESKDSLILFCRPSHDGWVGETLPYLHASTEVLYISKPGNRHYDVPDYAVEYLPAPGCRVEHVYKLLRPFPKFTEPNLAKAARDRLNAMLGGNDLIG